jgi:hypothetical protein
MAGVVKNTEFKSDCVFLPSRSEILDPCLLADPYVVSGWVEKRLGNVGLVKVTFPWFPLSRGSVHSAPRVWGL